MAGQGSMPQYISIILFSPFHSNTCKQTRRRPSIHKKTLSAIQCCQNNKIVYC